ncbi:MAG TPA: proline iminopeptidase, partial [Bacteroidota bacterium]|nr:proline iminopeptidase [Bacteroidota bacterium]
MNLKRHFPIALLFVLSCVFVACEQPKQESPLAQYFKTDESGIRSGGVKLIPIETPKGTFRVW